ncbi:MAG: hypothetical protein ACK58M_18140 [Acidobacteriota bacterium]|nr:hypothetical protein [Acidobacteriaceae bacterium]
MSPLLALLAVAITAGGLLHPARQAALLLVWLPFSNFVPPLLYAQFAVGAETVRGLIAIKDALLGMSLAGNALRQRTRLGTWQLADLLLLGYTLLLTLYFVLGLGDGETTVSPETRLGAFRNLLTPPLAWFAGRLLPVEAAPSLLRVLLITHTVVCAFGFYELFLLPLEFWSLVVEIGAFLVDVKGLLPDQNSNFLGLWANHIMHGMRRMVSFYGDPHSLGQASVVPIVYVASLAASGRRRWLPLLTLFMSALALSIHRESILATLLALGLLTWIRRDHNARLGSFALSLLFGTLIFTTLGAELITNTLTGQESSASVRTQFLEEAIDNLDQYWFGRGIGQAGGFAIGEGVQAEGVGENSYMALMGQTGLLSLLLLLGFLAAAILTLTRGAAATGSLLAAAIAAALFGRGCGALFSESLFGFTGTAPLFLFAGLALRTITIPPPETDADSPGHQ